jgi:hypothetical protein
MASLQFKGFQEEKMLQEKGKRIRNGNGSFIFINFQENSCGCEMAPSSIMGVNAMMQRAKINQSQQSSQPMRSLTPENMISEQWNNGFLSFFISYV